MYIYIYIYMEDSPAAARVEGVAIVLVTGV